MLNYLVPNNADLSPKDWFEVKVFGRELFKFGFWDLLFRVLTNEAYNFMKDAGGYDANVANVTNAVSLLPVGEFGPEVEFQTAQGQVRQAPKDNGRPVQGRRTALFVHEPPSHVDREAKRKVRPSVPAHQDSRAKA